MCECVYMWGSEDNWVEVDFFFLSCDSWGLNSGHKAWWQAALPVEPFHRPFIACFNSHCYYWTLNGFSHLAVESHTNMNNVII